MYHFAVITMLGLATLKVTDLLEDLVPALSRFTSFLRLAIGVGAAFFVQRSNDAQKAAQALTEASSGGAKSAGSVMRGDGAGCKNKAIAAELVALDDTNPRYIEIWAKGMQDIVL